MKLFLIKIQCFLLIGSSVFAQSPTYFIFSEKASWQTIQAHTQFTPGDNLVVFQKSLKKVWSLIDWTVQYQELERPQAPYSRRSQFGSWIRDRRDGSCFNTRARVLIAYSQTPVSLRSNNPCIVDKGQWEDPFDGQTKESASELQVDHMVPLKHSYDLGGWRWSKPMRCMFANFTATPEHLVPVGFSENARKGARAPDEYLPSHQENWCSYVKNWMRIKLIWGLPLQISEAQAIAKVIKEQKCESSQWVLSQEEILALRQKMWDKEHVCFTKGTTHLVNPQSTAQESTTHDEPDEEFE